MVHLGYKIHMACRVLIRYRKWRGALISEELSRTTTRYTRQRYA